MKEIKKTHCTLSTMLPVFTLTIAWCFAGHPMWAQSTQDAARIPIAQQRQPMSPDDHNPGAATAETTFSGKIVKSDNKFVLADVVSKTTYQLDDQQKAEVFLNKTVKVTGVLDPSTGTIRVTAIDPV